MCGCGGIGRRARFRSVWGRLHAGSTPVIRTIFFFEKLKNIYMSIENKTNMRCKYEDFLKYYERASDFG